MTTWHVLLYDGTMDFGGLGRAQVLDSVNVEADDEKGARAEAKRLKPGKRIKSAEKFWDWHITLRGRDKRKRETFVVRAVDEYDARRALSYNPRAWRFARYPTYGAKKQDEVIVKIERKETT